MNRSTNLMNFIIFFLTFSILFGIVKQHSVDLIEFKIPTISNGFVEEANASEKNETQESFETEVDYFSSSHQFLIQTAILQTLLNFLPYDIFFKKINLKKEIKPPKDFLIF